MSQDWKTFSELCKQAEAYLELQMWAAAWKVLDDLPAQFQNFPSVLLKRIDVLTALQLSTKALQMAEEAVAAYPNRAEVWHRLARLQAQAGHLDAATVSATHCIELDESMWMEMAQDEGLKRIW
ncbi:tetratricopeptide repeat protein [Roseimicrobium sp. ORNL1]|uniref:tetratricopeptide repeat protein n=1 Tax=Roseimicrobium sp. ORNL1 TaxID=2711231 RepID=UPI0013E1510F|nr:tetratricopeptide repeat protein [Roseimicrobium sp. ORNL1]QIF02868.1 tetratricopeptide repeat protein [Roseimicrobium sp. ORNL1]